MARKNARRLSSAELEADEAVITALKSLVNYEAAAGMPTVAELDALNAKVAARQQDEQTANIKAGTARDAAIVVEWERREAVMRTKAQVVAKYGRDSDEVKAIGLKRQIDRKRPTRRGNTTP